MALFVLKPPLFGIMKTIPPLPPRQNKARLLVGFCCLWTFVNVSFKKKYINNKSDEQSEWFCIEAPPFGIMKIIPPLPHPDKENISKPYKFKDL